MLLALIVTTDSLIMAAAILGGDATVLRFLSGASGLLTAVVLAAELIGAPMALRGPPRISEHVAKSADAIVGESGNRLISTSVVGDDGAVAEIVVVVDDRFQRLLVLVESNGPFKAPF